MNILTYTTSRISLILSKKFAYKILNLSIAAMLGLSVCQDINANPEGWQVISGNDTINTGAFTNQLQTITAAYRKNCGLFCIPSTTTLTVNALGNNIPAQPLLPDGSISPVNPLTNNPLAFINYTGVTTLNLFNIGANSFKLDTNKAVTAGKSGSVDTNSNSYPISYTYDNGYAHCQDG